ncbi:MAG: helix-turn-helix transcriptional regulator [Thermodesulfovibrionia bacterium]|nr:helix-turn-helix transcriptional regulator [Thermodesulfovibrionia bacterium]
MSFPARLKNLIKNKGISQYKLAKDLGKPESTIRSWVNGRTQPRDENAAKLAEYFDVHPAWLRYGAKEYDTNVKDSVWKIAAKIEKHLQKHPEDADKIEKFVEIITDEGGGKSKSTPLPQKKKERRSKSA